MPRDEEQRRPKPPKKRKGFVERDGKNLALVIIGEDAYSEDEYIIYNGKFPFQAKVKMVLPSQPKIYASDAYTLETGFVLYDFIWAEQRPQGKSLDQVMNIVQEALDADIGKANFFDAGDVDAADGY